MDTEFRDQISIRLTLYCLDLESGELLWERVVYAGNPAVGRHLKNSFASETPVTDGKAVYAYFAHQGLYAYDFDGNQLWATPLQAYPVFLELGGGASPALHGDSIYILNDNNEASFIAAFDKHDGREIWRTPRVGLGDNHQSGWSSPLVWENDLRTELVTIGPTTAISYDLKGDELWRMGKMANMLIPTPFAHDGLLYLVSGPPSSESRPIAAVRVGAAGDITMPEGATSSAHVAWYDWRAGTYLSTPVFVRGQAVRAPAQRNHRQVRRRHGRGRLPLADRAGRQKLHLVAVGLQWKDLLLERGGRHVRYRHRRRVRATRHQPARRFLAIHPGNGRRPAAAPHPAPPVVDSGPRFFMILTRRCTCTSAGPACSPRSCRGRCIQRSCRRRGACRAPPAGCRRGW